MAEPTLVERITNGGDIRVGLLGTTIVGGAIFAFFDGVVAFILETFALVTALPSGLASFFTELYGVVFGLLAAASRGAFREAIPLITSSGPAGLLVGTALVATTIYVGVRVISLAG